jgi:hypothetical protein
MPQIIDVPGQGQIEFPDSMDDAAIVAAIRGMTQPPKQAAAPQQSDENWFSRAAKTAGNVAAGAVRGAGSIGATALVPYDIVKDALAGKGLSLESNRQRRADIDYGLAAMGADPESLSYKGGKIAGEIAGTAGVPGVLGKGAQAVGAAPAIVNALRGAGTVGSLPARVASGAAAGGVAAGMVNPEDAAMGAAVGGALPAAGALAKGAVGLGRQFVGATTGVGNEALAQAFRAGKQGGATAQALRENMRGGAGMDDVLNAAKQNLDIMGQQKQAAYRAGMANVKADKSILDFADVDKAIGDALNVATFRGQVKNPEAAAAIQKISDQVNQWKQLNPAEFHTPEGLDALKQSISGVLEGLPYEQKTARLAAGKIYDAVKGTINKQAPEYSKVMKDYSEASDLINDIQKSLIGGNKATAESSMRKLQSLMRNNVNTSYGYRTELARELEQAGGQQIMPALAGQALQEWTPRGIQRAVSGGSTAGLALTGNVPAAAGMAALSSPRLMGELSYGAGRAAGAIPQSVIDALRSGTQRAAPVVVAQ